MITSEKLIGELRKATDNELSFMDAVMEVHIRSAMMDSVTLRLTTVHVDRLSKHIIPWGNPYTEVGPILRHQFILTCLQIPITLQSLRRI